MPHTSDIDTERANKLKYYNNPINMLQIHAQEGIPVVNRHSSKASNTTYKMPNIDIVSKVQEVREWNRSFPMVYFPNSFDVQTIPPELGDLSCFDLSLLTPNCYVCEVSAWCCLILLLTLNFRFNSNVQSITMLYRT